MSITIPPDQEYPNVSIKPPLLALLNTNTTKFPEGNVSQQSTDNILDPNLADELDDDDSLTPTETTRAQTRLTAEAVFSEDAQRSAGIPICQSHKDLSEPESLTTTTKITLENYPDDQISELYLRESDNDTESIKSARYTADSENLEYEGFDSDESFGGLNTRRLDRNLTIRNNVRVNNGSETLDQEPSKAKEKYSSDSHYEDDTDSLRTSDVEEISLFRLSGDFKNDSTDYLASDVDFGPEKSMEEFEKVYTEPPRESDDETISISNEDNFDQESRQPEENNAMPLPKAGAEHVNSFGENDSVLSLPLIVQPQQTIDEEYGGGISDDLSEQSHDDNGGDDELHLEPSDYDGGISDGLSDYNNDDVEVDPDSFEPELDDAYEEDEETDVIEHTIPTNRAKENTVIDFQEISASVMPETKDPDTNEHQIVIEEQYVGTTLENANGDSSNQKEMQKDSDQTSNIEPLSRHGTESSNEKSKKYSKGAATFRKFYYWVLGRMSRAWKAFRR